MIRGCAALVLIGGLVVMHMAQAIVIRHDVEDERYRIDAEQAPYLCQFAGGHGTAIGPHWVLSAAHVAKFAPSGAEVSCGNGQVARVTDRFFPAPLALHDGEGWQHDIALLRVEPALSIASFPGIYTESDEVGKTIQFIGYGGSGDGQNGLQDFEDGLLRQADNEVDAIHGGTLVFDFDFPPTALPLEGISGPGDSGGPALLHAERLFVVGVSSMQDAGDFEEGHYGVREFYARVSHYVPWITQVLNADAQHREQLAYRHRPCDGQPTPDEGAPLPHAQFAGIYQFESGQEISFRMQDNRLIKQAPDRELVYCGEDRYSYKDMDITIRFFRDASGAVQRMTYDQWFPMPADRLPD